MRSLPICRQKTSSRSCTYSVSSHISDFSLGPLLESYGFQSTDGVNSRYCGLYIELLKRGLYSVIQVVTREKQRDSNLLISQLTLSAALLRDLKLSANLVIGGLNCAPFGTSDPRWSSISSVYGSQIRRFSQSENDVSVHRGRCCWLILSLLPVHLPPNSLGPYFHKILPQHSSKPQIEE